MPDTSGRSATVKEVFMTISESTSHARTAGRSQPRSWTRGREGFTFIEVICILLVISIGLMGAIGLVYRGLIVAEKAQGNCTGMVTAMVVANDAQPMLPADMQASWTYSSYNFNDLTNTLSATSSGFVNGYYVTRVETTAPTDIIAVTPPSAVPPNTVYARSVSVAVDVYGTLGGTRISSFNTRVVRQRGQP
jgi:Tfp pilus assembly protein PilV